VRDRDRLAVSVRNGPASVATSPPSPPPAGTDRPGPRGRRGAGLDGMRQRVAAVGGTLSAGPDGDGWLVEGSIPLWRAGAEAHR
jgi:hypothetical protein